mmetsp:Transcript_12937/g.39493  ORF Transcript_12937/g.39493 Transcript_12937/m.39493 type:complete len:113 (+) Transcript_12937:1-339(+)
MAMVMAVRSLPPFLNYPISHYPMLSFFRPTPGRIGGEGALKHATTSGPESLVVDLLGAASEEMVAFLVAKEVMRAWAAADFQEMSARSWPGQQRRPPPTALLRQTGPGLPKC